LSTPIKLDYSNSLYYNLPKSQIQYDTLREDRRFTQNSLANIVVKAREFYHITPILRSLQSALAQD